MEFYNWDGEATTPFRYASTLDAATTPFVEVPGTTDIPLLDLNDGTTNLLTRPNLDPKFMSPGPAADGNVRQTVRVAEFNRYGRKLPRQLQRSARYIHLHRGIGRH